MKRPWLSPNVLDIWNWPQIFFLNICGWWAEEIPSHKIQRTRFYKILRVLVVLTQLIYTAPLIIGVVLSIARGQTDFLGVFTISAACMGGCKLFELIRNRVQMKKAMDLLDDLMKDAVMKMDSTLETKIRARYHRCWLLNIYFLVYMVLSLSSWLALPLIETLITGQKSVVAPSGLVFLNNWWQYSLTYLFQVFVIFNYGMALVLYGSVFFSISEGIIVQFTILKYHFRAMRTLEDNREREKWIRDCIDCHRRILKVCHLLRDSSKVVITITTTIISISICISVYTVMNDKLDEGMAMNVAVTTGFFLLLMFLFSWYCTEVIHQSESIATSIYSTGWENNWTNKEKRLIVIVASIAQKPLIFGGIIQMDLTTFIAILKTSFAYYNFLEAVTKNNQI